MDSPSLKTPSTSGERPGGRRLFLFIFGGAALVGIAVSPEYLWPAKSRQEVFTAGASFGVAFVSERLLDPLPATAVAEQTLVQYDDEAVSAASNPASSDPLD